MNQNYTTFPGDPFYQSLVNRITDRLYMNQIEVLKGNVPNATATMFKSNGSDKGKPVIVYNPKFMKDITDMNPWALYFVLAHEVGHHYNQDLYGNFLGLRVNKRMHKQELNADYFAGWILRCEGASIWDALSLADIIDLEEGYTHPSESKRRQSIRKGWNEANCAMAPPVQYVPEKPAISAGEIAVGVGLVALIAVGIGAALSKK